MHFNAMPFNIVHQSYWSRVNMSFSVRAKGTMVAMQWMEGCWRGGSVGWGRKEKKGLALERRSDGFLVNHFPT